MKLLIDAGNRRLKWAYLDGDGLGQADSATLDRHQPSLPQRLVAAGAPDGVVVCNVAGSRVAAAIRDHFVTHKQVDPRFVTASARAHGVRNAYARPAQLGADRWSAMIGAFAEYGGPLCVVDAGSACTIDMVAADGEHLGGLIIPGLALMTAALRAQTSDIASLEPLEPAAAAAVGLARNTADAMRAGPRLALAALIGKTAERAKRQLGEAVHVVMTGGDAEAVRGALDRVATYNATLVLRGLVEFAREADA